MMSRPNFEVDIVKSNGRTLSFTCSYLHPDEQQGGEEQGPGNIFLLQPVFRICIDYMRIRIQCGSGSSADPDPDSGK
jgi:hypothetical protein